jgi:hypothetical protein
VRRLHQLLAAFTDGMSGMPEPVRDDSFRSAPSGPEAATRLDPAGYGRPWRNEAEGVAAAAVFRQAWSDVLVSLSRPALVQTWSLTAALDMQVLNASRSAGGTMFSRQVTSLLRPEEESSPAVPVCCRQAVACCLAWARAEDEAIGVEADTLPPAGGVLVLLLALLLLQPTTARIPSVAATAAAHCFPYIADPPDDPSGKPDRRSLTARIGLSRGPERPSRQAQEAPGSAKCPPAGSR